MASKKKWKKRARRQAVVAQNQIRRADQLMRQLEHTEGQLDFHRNRANELQQTPLMTAEEKVDVEAAYQRGLEAGRAQHAVTDLERQVGLILGPVLQQAGSAESVMLRLNGLLAGAYTKLCALANPPAPDFGDDLDVEPAASGLEPGGSCRA